MNSEEFRKHGKNMIDYITDYRSNISERDVAPTLDPGYLRYLIPGEAPFEGEKFDDILKDVEEKIMPGVLHWNHPKFFAYFPNGGSYPSLLGDMLSGAISSQGFSWASCPASTELETIILDWYAKALGLPNIFLSDYPGSRGGGALQGSASECALVCMIAARARGIEKLRGGNLDIHESVFLPQLVAYASAEAHSSIEKAAKMALVKLHIIETDQNDQMRIDLLQSQIDNDIKNGLTPFFVVATVGTTGSCAFDDLNEIGKVCKKCPTIWFHVDGAYAGNSFILPEMRKFSEGLKYADSFNTNPNKFLLTAYDASAMWVKNVISLKAALTVNPLYLQHEHSKAIDYRHYGIPLSRRFRSLKLWFVFRSYGISGLQNYMRNHIKLAKIFEKLVQNDDRFEVMNVVHLGLVCFRLRSSDIINQELLALINHSGKSHMIPARINGKYVIRFCVTYEQATEEQMIDGWKEIQNYANEVIKDHVKTEEEENDDKIIGKPKRKLNRTKSMRFSFTRSISREQFDNQGEHLIDGCTPILFIETDDIEKSFMEKTNLNKIADVDSNDENNNSN